MRRAYTTFRECVSDRMSWIEFRRLESTARYQVTARPNVRGGVAYPRNGYNSHQIILVEYRSNLEPSRTQTIPIKMTSVGSVIVPPKDVCANAHLLWQICRYSFLFGQGIYLLKSASKYILRVGHCLIARLSLNEGHCR